MYGGRCWSRLGRRCYQGGDRLNFGRSQNRRHSFSLCNPSHRQGRLRLGERALGGMVGVGKLITHVGWITVVSLKAAGPGERRFSWAQIPVFFLKPRRGNTGHLLRCLDAFHSSFSPSSLCSTIDLYSWPCAVPYLRVKCSTGPPQGEPHLPHVWGVGLQACGQTCRRLNNILLY